MRQFVPDGDGLGIINIPDLSNSSEEFVSLGRYADIPWVKLSGQPKGGFERLVKRPRVSRYRGALEAVLSCRRFPKPILISHLPAMTASTSVLAKLLKIDSFHIAFSFNFTALPDGRRLKVLKDSFIRVDRFVVFSEFEKKLYSSYFNIPPEKISSILWTQTVPPINSDVQRPFPERYLCAVGGEGRDYKTLMNAAAATKIPMVVVARPSSFSGIDVPRNVKVFCNLPLSDTWGIAAASSGLIVPLKSPNTCCGQITVVSGQMLDLPMLTTTAHALEEYVSGYSAGIEVPAGDPRLMSEGLERLYAQESTRNTHEIVTIEKYSRSKWAKWLELQIDELRGR